MHQPNLTFNWAAIAASILAAFVFGYLWYGPILGKPWAKLMGLKTTHRPKPESMILMMVIQVFGTFLTTYVLAHSVQIWRPSVWGVGSDMPNHMYGFMGGFFTWLGFYVPMQLGKCTWEGKPWKLFLINASHDFLNLQIIAQILANWR